MKKAKRIFTLIITLALLATTFYSPALAAETALLNEILGSPSDETGLLLEDPISSDSVQPNLLPTFQYTEMFSMHANQVSDFLTTRSSSEKIFS